MSDSITGLLSIELGRVVLGPGPWRTGFPRSVQMVTIAGMAPKNLYSFVLSGVALVLVELGLAPPQLGAEQPAPAQ